MTSTFVQMYASVYMEFSLTTKRYFSHCSLEAIVKAIYHIHKEVDLSISIKEMVVEFKGRIRINEH